MVICEQNGRCREGEEEKGQMKREIIFKGNVTRSTPEVASVNILATVTSAPVKSPRIRRF